MTPSAVLCLSGASAVELPNVRSTDQGGRCWLVVVMVMTKRITTNVMHVQLWNGGRVDISALETSLPVA